MRPGVRNHYFSHIIVSVNFWAEVALEILGQSPWKNSSPSYRFGHNPKLSGLVASVIETEPRPPSSWDFVHYPMLLWQILWDAFAYPLLLAQEPCVRRAVTRVVSKASQKEQKDIQSKWRAPSGKRLKSTSISEDLVPRLRCDYADASSHDRVRGEFFDTGSHTPL